MAEQALWCFVELGTWLLQMGRSPSDCFCSHKC